MVHYRYNNGELKSNTHDIRLFENSINIYYNNGKLQDNYGKLQV